MSGLTRENYFDFDALSNSMINWALPEAGGSMDNYHWMKRAAAAKELSEEENSSIRIGVALHKYIENVSTFELVSCPMPGPGMMKVIKLILTKAPHIKSLVDPANAAEIVTLAREIGYGGSWKSDTVLKKVIEEGVDFFTAVHVLALSPGQVLVSPAEYLIIQNAIDRIKHAPWLIDPNEFYGAEWEIRKEVAIEFTCEGVKCKSLIDRLIVNHKSKEFCIEDLKTTSLPIDQYFGYTTKVFNPKTNLVEKLEIPGKYLERGVHRQLAFYGLAVISSGILPGYSLNSASVLALQTVAPYSFRMVTIDPGHLNAGIDIITQAVKMIAKHGEDTVEL